MSLLSTFIKYSMRLIYVLVFAIVLYFPTAELLAYIARETRFFQIPGVFPIDDALLPLFCLAVIYSVVAWLNRLVERRTDAKGKRD